MEAKNFNAYEGIIEEIEGLFPILSFLKASKKPKFGNKMPIDINVSFHFAIKKFNQVKNDKI